MSEREIPPGARVAVSRTVPMLMLLSGYRGKMSISELARAGVASAEAVGAKARAKIIRRVGAAGVLALRGPDLHDALLAAGGPIAGGALSTADIEEATPTEGEARLITTDGALDGTTVVALPTDHEGTDDRRVAMSETVVACDGRGTIAALAYAPFRDDCVALPGLELAIGGDAVPVRRGVTRVTPGTVLRAPMRIAIAIHGGTSIAVGFSGRGVPLDAGDFAWLAGGAAFETAVQATRDRLGAPAAAGVLTNGKLARLTLAR